MDELETTQDAPETDDYFEEYSEVIDDHGNPIETADPATQEEAPAVEPVPVAKAPEAEAPAVEAPAEAKDDIPDDFFGRFFEKTEEGEVAFKGDDAIDLLYPENDTDRFKYNPIAVAADTPPDPNAEPGEPEWRKELDAEREYRNNIKTNLYTPLEHVERALRAGQSAEQALAYARQQTDASLDDVFKEREYENEAKRREAIEKDSKAKAQMIEMKERSLTNERKYHDKLGGPESFQKVFFGYKDKAGKNQPGVASDSVYHLFKSFHPEHKTENWTAKQLSDKMGDWWTSYTSDPENMAFLYEIAKGKMMLHPTMKKQLISKIRSTAQGQIKQNREGALPKKAGLSPANRTAKSETQSNAMEAFLNPMASRNSIPSI